MLVTFTNATGSQLHVSSLYTQLEAGASVTTRRAWSDLERDQHLKDLIQTGSLTLAFTKESGDNAHLGASSSPLSYDNTSRPNANTVAVFTFIWNTSDNALNWSDGTAWRDATGNIT